MAKKTVRKAAKKTARSVGAKKTTRKPRGKLDAILRQQEMILKNETALKREEDSIKSLEQKELSMERQALAGEKEEQHTEHATEAELVKLEALENEVKQSVREHPLKRVTLKDLMKGIVGAFVGVVVHFTFTYGVEVADRISTARATLLLFLTFLIGAGFLYGTGFRKMEDNKFLWLVPYRAVVLYATAIIVTVATLGFFYPQFFADLNLAYRQVAVVNLSAVIGACTADLIGRE